MAGALSVPTKEDIDTDLLIDQVQIHSLLYDKTHPDYSNFVRRHNTWMEIGANIFYQWSAFDKHQKVEASKNLQSRWKNIRACFTRELREQRNTRPTNKKRRKYRHFDRLLFLQQFSDPEEVSGLPVEEEEAPSIEEEAYNEVVESPRQVLRRKLLVNKVDHTSSYEERLAHALEKQTDQEMKDQAEAQVKNFALSLVPLIMDLPADRRLPTQISILQVIQHEKSQQH